MSINIVVGGQYGSEGKGKMTAHLSRHHDYNISVRCGGPNSGHTVHIDKKPIVLRQIPSGVVKPRSKVYVSSGCLIDLEVLFEEIEMFDLTPDRLGIDPNAMVINPEYMKGEWLMKLRDRIGSTCSGTGIAVAKRVLRAEDVKLARDIVDLNPYIKDVSNAVMLHYKQKEKIVIEGTQGFGLSLYHGPHYPFATSRDTIAAAFLSEVGISPLLVTDITMVVRTFPIRVGGNSGPLKDEITWDDVRNESQCPDDIKEFTSVTKRLRRVGRFDLDMIGRAMRANCPTELAVMGMDYLDYENLSIKSFNDLSSIATNFVNALEKKFGVMVSHIGVGPDDDDIVSQPASSSS